MATRENFARFFAGLIALGLFMEANAFGDGVPATQPASSQAQAAGEKFQASIMRAEKARSASLAKLRAEYLADLQKALDVALNAANIEDARWARAEMTRVKDGADDPGPRPASEYNLGVFNRFNRLREKLGNDHRRTLEDARRACLADLEAAKKTATVRLRDLDEAERIVAEEERVKKLDFGKPLPRTINLLEIVKPERDAVNGKWKLENGQLIAAGGSYPVRIEFPYQPSNEYDFSVSFVGSPEHFFRQVCVVAGQQFSWSVSNTCSFRKLNGIEEHFGPEENLKEGKVYKSVVKVRKDSVEAFLDGKLISSFKIDATKLDLPDNDSLRHKDTIGIVSHLDGHFEKAEILEVTGEGKILP